MCVANTILFQASLVSFEKRIWSEFSSFFSVTIHDRCSQICGVVCLFGFLTSSSATRLSHGRVPRLTSDNFTCCHTETEQGDHDLCFSRSHYTDTDPTSGEQVWGSHPQLPDHELHALPLSKRTPHCC